jgi:hypothetical protein
MKKHRRIKRGKRKVLRMTKKVKAARKPLDMPRFVKKNRLQIQ